MSTSEESAIDALVDEVMNARDSAEAASSPEAVSEVAADEATVEDQVHEADETPTRKIGFAEMGTEAPVASAMQETPAIETIQAERDGFLADSQRLAADFANYRKQSDKRVADAAAAQSAGLVRDLIPILDACDSALVQDPESAIAPIRNALLTELQKNGLELLAPADNDPFDPEQHEAVMHEPAAADSEQDGPLISEILRAGYLWKGRVVRPAMVKVVG